MKINLNESLTGFQRTIQHLDGRHVLIRHPADQPITPNSMKRISNQGMINMETHHTGDLIIQFDVEFPPMNFFNDSTILHKLENLLPAKSILNVPLGVNLDEASSMIDYKKESKSTKHRAQRIYDENNEEEEEDDDDDDDDDQYVDDDDDEEKEDDHPQVHQCQTH